MNASIYSASMTCGKYTCLFSILFLSSKLCSNLLIANKTLAKKCGQKWGESPLNNKQSQN